MVLKRAKCDLPGDKIAIFAVKLQKLPSSWWLCPLCNTLELRRFVQHGTSSSSSFFIARFSVRVAGAVAQD